ncbi:MAG: methyltransferase domain-containing protein [Gemmatimonadetes bacterium]|nr:methyltransferase domain-containing protein [Gemmatimonadota bacterium]
MSDQPIGFDGEIPRIYDRCLGPFIFEPNAADVPPRLPLAPGARVLEIACGTGRVTQHLLAALPEGATLVATDLSAAMLAVAQERLGADLRVTWQEADALALPFAEGSFDAVVCQFGVMFFPDKLAGLREMHRVLTPGGRVLFSTWDAMAENPYAAECERVVVARYPDDPPTFFQVPFGMHDRAMLAQLTSDAGFIDVRVAARADVAESPRALDAATGFVRGNAVGTFLRGKGADLDAIAEEVAAAFRAKFGDAPMRAPMQALFVTGRRAG